MNEPVGLSFSKTMNNNNTNVKAARHFIDRQGVLKSKRKHLRKDMSKKVMNSQQVYPNYFKNSRSNSAGRASIWQESTKKSDRVGVLDLKHKIQRNIQKLTGSTKSREPAVILTSNNSAVII